jgi:long-subunit fatty acid transport protein
MLASWDVTLLHPQEGQGGMGETNWKLGWRLGTEYRINKQWSVSAFYNVAHWQNYTADSINTNNTFQCNPSWFAVMAGYKF